MPALFYDRLKPAEQRRCAVRISCGSDSKPRVPNLPLTSSIKGCLRYSVAARRRRARRQLRGNARPPTILGDAKSSGQPLQSVNSDCWMNMVIKAIFGLYRSQKTAKAV